AAPAPPDTRRAPPGPSEAAPDAASPLREAGLAATGYDEQDGTEIVDRTRTTGDAVRPLDDGTGELLFRACDFGDGVCGVSVEASGSGAVDLISGSTATTVTVPATGGAYDYTLRTSGFTAAGVRDLRVRLRGPLRLARLTFTATAQPRETA
ncbi:sugar hydrolase, partial [Streptomyces sp. NPDC055366]